jgi:hypothetical protein
LEDTDSVEDESPFFVMANDSTAPTILPPKAAERKKKSADAKWTKTQEQKLVAAVLGEKAYIRTEISQQKKYEVIAAKLMRDRDFNSDPAFTGKEWQAYKKKFDKLMDALKTGLSLESEGANLSKYEDSKIALLSPTDSMLYTMALELETAHEVKKLLSEKEKECNRSCLRHEAAGLAGKSDAESTPHKEKDVESELTSSGTKLSSGGGGAFDGFLLLVHEMTLARSRRRTWKSRTHSSRFRSRSQSNLSFDYNYNERKTML